MDSSYIVLDDLKRVKVQSDGPVKFSRTKSTTVSKRASVEKVFRNLNFEASDLDQNEAVGEKIKVEIIGKHKVSEEKVIVYEAIRNDSLVSDQGTLL